MSRKARGIVCVLLLAAAVVGGYRLWRAPMVQDQLLSRADISSLNERVVADPTNWRAHYWYGKRLAELGKFEQAEKSLRVLLGNDPSFIQGYAELGKVLLAQNRVEEAFQLLRLAVGRDPKNTEAQLALALLYRTQGAYHLAAKEAQAIVNREPKNVRALYELAASQALMTEFGKAETTLRQALETAPKDIPTLLGLSRVLRDQGKVKDSERIARDAVAVKPDDVDALMLLAEILTAKKAVVAAQQEALKLTEQARKLDEGRLDVAWLQAQLMMEQGRWSHAVTELTRIVQGSPNTTQAYFLLGRAYRQLGQAALAAKADASLKKWEAYDRTVRSLNDRIGVEPENARLRFQLAQVHDQMGRKDLAIMAYRAGLQRDPDNRQARSRFVKLLQQNVPQ